MMMDQKRGNIVQQVQEMVVELLNASGLNALAQDTANLEFELQNAIASIGRAVLVTRPQLQYQGTDSSKTRWYDAIFEVQVADNPTMVDPLSTTADDIIAQATEAITGGEWKGVFTPTSVTHDDFDEMRLNIARAEFKGIFALKHEQKPGWTASGAYNGRFELAREDQDGTKHYLGPDGMSFTIDPQPGGWSFIFKVPDVMEHNIGVVAGTLPNTIIFEYEGEHTEFVPDVKSPHYNWSIVFEQPIHEDCIIEWMYSNIEPVQGLGNLMTHYFRSEDKLVNLKVIELPSTPQQADKDRFELAVGQDQPPLSIFDVDRAATSVVDTYYHATLTKIEPNN